MFAWSRRTAFALLALVSLVYADDQDSIYTSSVSYCAPPSSLLIQQFDVAYFKHNTSVSFNISAASVMSLNVSANLFLNAYGMKPLNVSLDLCNILDGILCPLPKYNFIGEDSIKLPSSVDVTSNLPGIAYAIPDLEAYAQLTLTDTDTGDLVACVQSTLANGHTTHLPAVEWATGGLALLALASALWHAFVPESLAPVRLLDLMQFYQTIASSGLLALNFPSVYRSFTFNFAWALGLFRSSGMQKSINEMRAKTGGSNVNGTSNAIGLINRSMSPYNNGPSPTSGGLATFSASGNFVASIKSFSLADLHVPKLSARGLVQRTLENAKTLASAGEVQNYNPSTDDVLEAGVPIYVNYLRVGTANAFMTVFLCALIFFAISIGVLGLIYALTFALTRNGRSGGRLHDLKARYILFIRAWALRIALICFIPVTLFAFYQWTLKDSWLSILLSVLLLLTILAAIAIPAFFTFRVARRFGAESLRTDQAQLAPHGTLYAPYRSERWYFFVPSIATMLLRSIVIGFIRNGMVQIILVLILELAYLITILTLRPSTTRGRDVFSSYMAITRVVGAGLMIAFIESIGVKPIPRVAIGFVLIVLFSIAIIVLFLNICCHVGLIGLFRRRRPDEQARADAGEASMLEKAEKADTPVTSYAEPLPHTVSPR